MSFSNQKLLCYSSEVKLEDDIVGLPNDEYYKRLSEI